MGQEGAGRFSEQHVESSFIHHMGCAAAKWKHIAGARGSPSAPGCCGHTALAATHRTGNCLKKRSSNFLVLLFVTVSPALV